MQITCSELLSVVDCFSRLLNTSSMLYYPQKHVGDSSPSLLPCSHSTCAVGLLPEVATIYVYAMQLSAILLLLAVGVPHQVGLPAEGPSSPSLHAALDTKTPKDRLQLQQLLRPVTAVMQPL